METCETNRYGQIDTIDWQMMDKKRFLVYSLGNVVILRSFLYPLTVIKTNLQVQKSHQVYDGAFHAFRKIVGQEGFKGLYRGFMVNSIQVVSGCAYILTLEKMRDVCTTTFDIRDNALKGLIAGGLSSMVSQTINTPFDVVSQHLMLLNKQKSSFDPNNNNKNNVNKNGVNHASKEASKSSRNSQESISKKSRVKPLSIDTRSLTRFQINMAVIRQLYKTDGPAGFYRGYFASLVQYIPSSMLFWIFYPTYSQLMVDFHKSSKIVPTEKFSKQPIDLLAGSLAGISVAIITNPLDVLRVNIQVQRIPFIKALKTLWQQDGISILHKGLTARLFQTMISSACLAYGYETVKRLSTKPEFQDQVRW